MAKKLKIFCPGEVLSRRNFLFHFNITTYKLAKDIEIPSNKEQSSKVTVNYSRYALRLKQIFWRFQLNFVTGLQDNFDIEGAMSTKGSI